MRSFVKIYGPPIYQALKELEKIAVNMPDVCIMSAPISLHLPMEIIQDINLYSGYENRPRNLDPQLPEFAWRYLNSSGILVSRERCENIISKSGVDLGENDFYFEWKKKPSIKDIEQLINNIDLALEPLGCLYTLTTK